MAALVPLLAPPPESPNAEAAPGARCAAGLGEPIGAAGPPALATAGAPALAAAGPPALARLRAAALALLSALLQSDPLGAGRALVEAGGVPHLCDALACPPARARPGSYDSPPVAAVLPECGGRWGDVCRRALRCALDFAWPAPRMLDDMRCWRRDSDWRDSIQACNTRSQLLVACGRVKQADQAMSTLTLALSLHPVITCPTRLHVARQLAEEALRAVAALVAGPAARAARRMFGDALAAAGAVPALLALAGGCDAREGVVIQARHPGTFRQPPVPGGPGVGGCRALGCRALAAA